MRIVGGFADIESRLARLTEPVRLMFFTQTVDCAKCLATRQILDVLSRCSERITLEEYNLVLDKDTVEEYKIKRVPAVAIVSTSREFSTRGHTGNSDISDALGAVRIG